MTCWPPCSPWCDCINGQCQSTPVQINAVRLRTRDGRYLQAIIGGGAGLWATTVGDPQQWETFRFAPPTLWPLASGDPFSLVVCDSNWAPSVNQVRVEHSRTPGPGLVGHLFGGPETFVLVRTPFPAGFPGYQGDDPALERTFSIIKSGGGQINTGDEISLRITSGRLDPSGNDIVHFFRTTGAQDQAHIGGDGTIPFQADTIFVVEFSEVRAGLGFRPPSVNCQICGTVTGKGFATSAKVRLSSSSFAASGELS